MDEKLREAYKTMQEACGLKVGDRVRVLRKFSSYEMGSSPFWNEAGRMSETIGNEYNITSFYESSIGLSSGWSYPFFVLEKVEDTPAPTPPASDADDVCVCGHKRSEHAYGDGSCQVKGTAFQGYADKCLLFEKAPADTSALRKLVAEAQAACEKAWKRSDKLQDTLMNIEGIIDDIEEKLK